LEFIKNKLLNVLRLIVLILALNACNNDSEPIIDVVENVEISEFSFLILNNPNLLSNVYLSIEGNKIIGRIPQNIDVSELIANFEFSGSSIAVNNVPQTSAITKNDFTGIVSYTVKSSSGAQISYEIDVTKFTGLPLIYLSTNQNAPIDSKEDYVDGSIIIDGGRNFSSLNDSSMKIRGRGNSTWYVHPKKPYQLKLSDEHEFLDMPSEKKWLFLAEYSDKTMMRNSIAFEMGYLSNLDWTPESNFAEVYLNDSYNGTYNITQKVEEGVSRVNLEGSGYLLEIDQFERLDADDVYFYTGNFLINIKEPELEFNSDSYNYVKNLLNEFETNLYSTQFKHPTEGYANYIDIDSFIDWYLINEITKNQDSKSFSSIFLNVIPGQKIKMGPLWDFDLAFGNVNYSECELATGFWVKDHKWYSRLFEDEFFVEKVKTRFNYFKENETYILDKMDFYANQLKWSQQENDMVWETLGIYVWPNPVVYNTYEEEVSHLKSWYSERMSWLDNAFSSL